MNWNDLEREIAAQRRVMEIERAITGTRGDRRANAVGLAILEAIAIGCFIGAVLLAAFFLA